MTPTTLRPTTMRGMPLTDLLVSHSPRGFYVTKSTTDSSTTNVLGRTETVDPLTTDVTTVPTEERIATIAVNIDGEENGQIVDKISPEETTTNWESDSSTSTTSLDLETEEQQGSFIATIAQPLETEYVDDTSPEDSKTSSTITRIATTASVAMTVSSSDSSTKAQSVSTFSTKPPTTLSFFSSTNVPSTRISSVTPTKATETKIPSTSSSTAQTTSLTSEIAASKDLISTSSTMDFKIPDDSPTIESSPSTVVDAEKTDEISTLAVPTDIDVSSTTISSITPTNNIKSELPPTSSSTARTISVTAGIPVSKYPTSTSPTMNLKTPENSSIVDNSTSTMTERIDEISTSAVSTDIDVVDRTNVTAKEDSTTSSTNFASIKETTFDTKAIINIPETNENSAQDKENESTVEALRSTVSSTFVETSTTSVRTKSNVRRRQRVRVKATNDEFGRKKPGRTSLDQRVAEKRPAEEGITTRILDEVPRPHTRRRITVYRGRHRATNATRTSLSATILNDVPKPPNLPNSRSRPRKRVVLKRVKSKSAEARTSTKNEEERMIGKESVVEDGPLRDSIPSEENSDRTVAEVNSPKSAGQASRAGGSQSTSRLRKTNSSTSTAQVQNKSANAATSFRKNRPANATLTTTIIEILDSKNATTEATEKDIDQSSRAQELAVTLADPPSAQSITGTGRLPLRDALRRKISTTVVPRTEPTTSRTTLRFTTVQRNRQRPKPKDKPLQKVPTRPRRPPVIDYDYYEDEEEAVVRKTTLNEKLFLTSKGTIRCLDQGNFPHPYSCKKFITCARMVNGQVTGAEYTCPDKLSFDPVGGICNWSAGLGCKE